MNVRSLDVEVALRAALAAVVPLAILLSIGRPEWTPYAAFGGMTAIFGRGEAYRGRLRTVTVATVGLVASVALGIAAAVAARGSGGGAVGVGSAASAEASAATAITALMLVVVLVGGVLAVNVARLAPPTPLFFVFAVLVCAAVPTPTAEVGVRLGIAIGSAAFAWALSLSGRLLRRVGSARFKPLRPPAPVRWSAVRDPAVWTVIALHVVGALLAGGIALASGLGHPYWAVVSVCAVIPPAGAAHSLSRAWHRVLGTAVGVGVTALILWPDPAAWVLVIVVAVAQFGAEVLIGRHYGAALVFVTPLALVVAHLAQPVAVGGLLVDRLVETALGCAVGILAVLAGRAIDARRGARAGR
ncbi:FUSC family protein [Agromyces sp. CFH 90414]|uniref:FUSC family protein n=1 Tax=Agromyces agglutinans TaxID=2662258 RepID=A0A6I2FEJ1_9MICO|nr:FUSC family protein [Agromyces agglutinans]MRG61110.1 FUSC family protein [Agromyces agglutinans]